MRGRQEVWGFRSATQAPAGQCKVLSWIRGTRKKKKKRIYVIKSKVNE